MLQHQSSQVSKIPGYLFAFGLVMVLAIGYWSYRKATASERLFYTYFEVIPANDYGQSRAVVPTAKPIPTREQAIRFQMEDNYQAAFNAWQAHLEEYGDEQPLDQLYAAANAMAFGHEEQAAWYLENMPPLENTALSQEVQWYRALLYLMTNEVAKSAATLAKIDTSSAPARMRRQLPDLRRQLANLRE